MDFYRAILKDFIYRLSIRLSPLKECILPSYKGSLLKGAICKAGKQIACLRKEDKECKDCALSSHCLYSRIFEPYIAERKMDLPPPFLIEPPLDGERIYKKGEFLDFHILIFGKAIEYLPYFVLLLQKMGENGLGKSKSPFSLIKIKALNRIVYEKKKDVFKNLRLPLKLKTPTLANESLTLHFLTPTRIKVGGKLINNLPFPLFFNTLLRRIKLLKNYAHHPIEIDYPQLKKLANEVITLRSELKWCDWERYSQRQKTLMKLGGFVGKVTYKGRNLRKLMPYIAVGEQIHVGKSCIFGLGKYRIERHDEA